MSKLCSHRDCGSSMAVGDIVTFGSGLLDDYGFWERPCEVAARNYEAQTGEVAWPFKREGERIANPSVEIQARSHP